MEGLPRTCGSVQENLWRYIDRELSAPALLDISAHLKSCEDCRKVYEGRARDASLFREAFLDSPFGEHFIEGFRKRFVSIPLPATPLEVLEGTGLFRSFRGFLRSNPRKFLGRAALAAALLFIGATVFFGLKPDGSLGTLEVSGALKMVRSGESLESPAGKLRPGDRLLLEDPDGKVKIVLKDGSKLILQGTSRFSVDRSSRAEGRFLATLEEGFLTGSVEHRGADRALSISSPDAVVRVVGTMFTLKVAPQEGTTLEVQEGEVQFKRILDDACIRVTPRSGPYLASSGGIQALRTRPTGIVEEPSGVQTDKGIDRTASEEKGTGAPEGEGAAMPDQSPMPGSTSGAGTAPPPESKIDLDTPVSK